MSQLTATRWGHPDPSTGSEHGRVTRLSPAMAAYRAATAGREHRTTVATAADATTGMHPWTAPSRGRGHGWPGQVKGYAPLLLDFPMEVGDRTVPLCWLEGDDDIDWYHELELGCMGRRPIRDLD